jgi:hypothetical protein
MFNNIKIKKGRPLGALFCGIKKPPGRSDGFDGLLWVNGRLTFALGPLACQFAGATYCLGFFTGALFRWLFVMATKLHFPEDSLTLHLFLQRFESLIDIVVTNLYLHA